MMGRLPIAKMLAVTVALTALMSVVMLQIHWNGQAASTAATDVDRLLDVMIVLSSFVFSLVMVMLFYALWKFKAKPGDESDGEPIHGNTRLEVAWTLIPTVIVLFGAGYSWAVLNKIEEPADNPITVDVFSQQFAWSFGYPGKGLRLFRRGAARPARPPGPLQDACAGRDPFLLGPRVADQEGQRARASRPRRS